MGDKPQFDRRVSGDYNYAEYDGVTLARVYQSLSNVYNQTIRKLGDNDLKVELTGVSARHGAGALEMIINYDHEALTKTRDSLASSSRDGDYVFSLHFFLRFIQRSPLPP